MHKIKESHCMVREVKRKNELSLKRSKKKYFLPLTSFFVYVSSDTEHMFEMYRTEHVHKDLSEITML